jgi:HSP20 family protein
MSNLLESFVKDIFGQDLEKFQKEVDNFLDDAYKDAYVPSFKLSKGSYPKVNILEKEDFFEILAATPGMAKEDLEVKYSDGILSITGKSNQEELGTNDKWICRELKKSSFIRSFRIDENLLDIENIKSSYDLGELKIIVPKNKKKNKKDGIKINIS